MEFNEQIKAIPGTIRCCICGLLIEPNNAAMCIECIRRESSASKNRNIEEKRSSRTSGNTDLIDILQCSKCERWLQGKANSSVGSAPAKWSHLEYESTGLLNLCLRQFIPLMTAKLDDFKIINSHFVWTEPHSRRLKVCVDYQRSVLDRKVVLQEQCMKEFCIKTKQCSDCIREASDHTWGSLIQVRTHFGSAKKSGPQSASIMGQLEQLLLTGSARPSSSGNSKKGAFPVPIQDFRAVRDGMDLFFKDKNQADKAADVISAQLPIVRTKTSSKMVSHDPTSHTYVRTLDLALPCS